MLPTVEIMYRGLLDIYSIMKDVFQWEFVGDILKLANPSRAEQKKRSHVVLVRGVASADFVDTKMYELKK